MDPIRFVFGLHVHQPVGNFDHVFEEHAREVYLPFLRRLAERSFTPIVLHISGPLLEWLEAHGDPYLDLVGRLVADGRVELLLSGFYEPVLAALPRADRLEQITWMREALRRRFGVEATGLWLTERVWEPELAADLARAGVRYALVDDRHFLVTGIERDQLHAPWWTESDGERLALFAIDERLRYLIPFKPPAETVAYLRALRGAGHRLAVLVDDGEKFGGWPGTREWVFEHGWLERFVDTLEGPIAGGEVRLSTLAEALDAVPSAGLAYLPTASYREMEGWALPEPAARRLLALERELGEERLGGPDGALVRGAHWRNFMVKYPEANRMHKAMQALSARCRAAGDPPAARRAIGRAQCNDAYWHGVFGGLYLPHLREAIWRNLAEAEGILQAGTAPVVETLDIDADGRKEIEARCAAATIVVSPARGGGVERYMLFAAGRNVGDVLTRRPEGYHFGTQDERRSDRHRAEGGAAPSIHEIEQRSRLKEPPPFDREDRALSVIRVLPAALGLEWYARGAYASVASWARTALVAETRASADGTEILLRPGPALPGHGLREVRIRLGADGVLHIRYRWDPAAFPPGAIFAPEFSMIWGAGLVCTPATEVWSFPITTVAKSERGFDETVQGYSHTPRWAVGLGEAEVEVALSAK